MSAVAPLAPARIRPMHDSDVDWVCAIERAVYSFPWTKGIFRDCLRVGCSCWAAEVSGQIAGYAILSVAGDEAHILNLCVDPKRRGTGLGRAMLRRLLHAARFHRANSIYLEVRPTNFIARRLYQHAGFVERGRRPRYYPGHGEREDAIIMQLALSKQSKS